MKIYLKKVSVNETSKNGIFTKHSQAGYIIISAFREGSSTPEIYKKNLIISDELRNDIKRSGFSYTPVWGGFVENEKENSNDEPTKVVKELAFIVFNFKRSEKQEINGELQILGEKLCKKYNQDFFLIKYPDGDAKYLNHFGQVLSTFGSISPAQTIDKYFTSLHKSSKKDPKANAFTFRDGILYFQRKPQTMAEAYLRDNEIIIDLE